MPNKSFAIPRVRRSIVTLVAALLAVVSGAALAHPAATSAQASNGTNSVGALAQPAVISLQSGSVTNTWVVWSPPTSYPETATLSASTIYTYATTVTGSAVLPGGSTVYVKLTGEIVNPKLRSAQPGSCSEGFGSFGGGPSGFVADSTACATYWRGLNTLQVIDGSTFISANVPTTDGTNGDKIGLIGTANGGAPFQRLEFFSDAAMTVTTPVANLALLLYSLGNANLTGEWRFDQDFTILSHNRNVFQTPFTGGGFQKYETSNDAMLRGREGSGAIQFTGTFDQLSWEVVNPESWASWQVGFTTATPPVGSLDLSCGIPPLASGQSATIGGTTVTATEVSAVASGVDYRFQNDVTVSATLEFDPPILAFRAITTNHADAGGGNFEEFVFTATSGASTAVDVSTSALRNINGTFNYLPGASLSALVSTLTVDYRYDINATTPGARDSLLRLFLNCSTLTPIPNTRALQVGTAIGPVYMSRDGFGGSITYAITGGTLPAGLTFDTSTGTITGTPTSALASTVTVSATGSQWGFNTAVVTFTGQAPSQNPTIVPPSSELSPTVPSVPSAPTTTTPPVPVRDELGQLPTVAAGSSELIENGVSVPVETFIDNGDTLVMRNQDFELRLAGQCTTGCTISVDDTGRETLVLQKDGDARVTGFGFMPATLVHVWLFSEPRYLGALLVDANGDYAGSFPLEGVPAGVHTLQVNGFSFDGNNRTANLGVIVGELSAPTPSPTTLPAAGASAMQLSMLALLLLGVAGMIGLARRRLVVR
jgi:hypothetical protein